MARSTAKPRDGGRNVLAEAMARCRRGFGTMAIFSLCLNTLALAGPLYMLQVYDRVLASGRVETLVMLTLILMVTLLAWAALDALRSAIAIRLGVWFSQALGPHFIESGILARLEGHEPGGQAFRDLGQVQSFLSAQGMTAFFDMPWTPLFIAVIWVLHPWLGILAASSVALLFVVSVLNEVLTKAPLKEANEGAIAASRLAEASIRNADAVQAMGMSRYLIARWSELSTAAQAATVRASQVGAILAGSAKFLRMFFQSGILGLGALLVIRGEATPGVMIAGSILLGRALAPVDTAMAAWKSFSTARIAYARLQAQSQAFPPARRRTSLPNPQGGLKVADLTVVVGGTPILRRVSFAAEAGEAVAVIGPSAAGKSTLCRALVGLLPSTGSIQLGGVELSLWNPDELGPHIGYLPQEAALFGGTIRDNIARMQDASDEKVVEAAELAHAHEMIARMPDGYETVLGEGGAGLSGGQRQRIGLARAVFGSPKLIVLDEPNANLDQIGEAALAEAILSLKQRGATLFIIGHRPSTLAQADKILLLKDGVVQAYGPRNDVLARMRQASQARTAQTAAPMHEQPANAAPSPELKGEPLEAGPRPFVAKPMTF